MEKEQSHHNVVAKSESDAKKTSIIQDKTGSLKPRKKFASSLGVWSAAIIIMVSCYFSSQAPCYCTKPDICNIVLKKSSGMQHTAVQTFTENDDKILEVGENCSLSLLF